MEGHDSGLDPFYLRPLKNKKIVNALLVKKDGSLFIYTVSVRAEKQELSSCSSGIVEWNPRNNVEFPAVSPFFLLPGYDNVDDLVFQASRGRDRTRLLHWTGREVK